jgi:hypothetical protein
MMNDVLRGVADYWLNHGLDHLSPTQKNKPLCNWFWEYVYNDQDWRRKKKPSSKMYAGISAQIGWDYYILFDYSEQQSIDLALADYGKYKGKFLGDEKELAMFNVNAEAMPKVIKNYIQALNDLDVKKHKTINSERVVNHWIDGIEVPWTGRTDMETEEFFIEGKTKWQRRGSKARKDGTFNYGKVAIAENPDKAHVDQVAFYKTATQKPGYLIYATPYEYKIFSTSESSSLSSEITDNSMKDYYWTALTRQNLLKISNDAQYIARNFIQPDFNNINYFSYTPDEIQEVKKFYGRR